MGKIKPFTPKVIKKPWGREVWIADEEEYGGKILEVRRGFTTSLHYHKVKKETIYVLKGKLRMIIKDKSYGEYELLVNEGESITLKPNTIHRIEALEDSTLIEVSTQPLNERVRLEDYYGDIGRD